MEKRFKRSLLATACIPWNEDWSFDKPHFRQEIELLCNNGIDSIYLFGTAGEGYAVSNEQYTEIVEYFMELMAEHKSVIPIVGIISLSAAEVKHRIEIAAGFGVEYFQISFPSWGAVTDDEALIFLKDICLSYPDFRFMHYNNGARSRNRLSPKAYVKIAEEIPNLVAVKFPGASIDEIHTFCNEETPIQVFLLEDAYGYGALASEFSLLISVLNISYKKAHEYYELCAKGDYKAMLRLHSDFNILYDILFSVCSGSKIDSAYDKIFVTFAIPDFPVRLLPPYTAFSDEQIELFKTKVKEALPSWFE